MSADKKSKVGKDEKSPANAGALIMDRIAKLVDSVEKILLDTNMSASLSSYAYSGFNVKAVINAILDKTEGGSKDLVLIIAYGLQSGPNTKGISKSLADKEQREEFELAIKNLGIQKVPSLPDSLTIPRIINAMPIVSFMVFDHMKKRIQLPITPFTQSDELKSIFFSFYPALLSLSNTVSNIAMFFHCCYSASFTKIINKKMSNSKYCELFAAASKFALAARSNAFVTTNDRNKYEGSLSNLNLDSDSLCQIIKMLFKNGLGNELLPNASSIHVVLNRLIQSNSDVSSLTSSMLGSQDLNQTSSESVMVLYHGEFALNSPTSSKNSQLTSMPSELE